MWTDAPRVLEMLLLAEEHTRKGLDYGQAKELLSYLDTRPERDNSSLGHVTIRASFDHVTWDRLHAEMEREPRITLQELDVIMGKVQVQY